MGRPSYEPTEADRNTVRIMAAAGITHEQIAQCIGSKGIAPKTLRLHFRRELDTAMTMFTAVAVSKLSEAVNRGEAWAICFYLKARAGWRETQQVDSRFIDKDGNDRSALTLADIDRMRADDGT